jgi:hypothetical protein
MISHSAFRKQDPGLLKKKPGGLPDLIFTTEISDPEVHALQREKQYPIAVF